jgi:hypothetical protein
MLLKFWRKKQASIRKNLEGSGLHRLWGQTLFHKLLWCTDRRSIAGGLAFGLFIAFTPTIGFQMSMAVIGAILLKVNLPIAIAACWLTNPLTIAGVHGRMGTRQLPDRTYRDYSPFPPIPSRRRQRGSAAFEWGVPVDGVFDFRSGRISARMAFGAFRMASAASPPAKKAATAVCFPHRLPRRESRAAGTLCC